MPTRWLRRVAILSALVVPVLLGPLPAARAVGGGIQTKPIGSPTWSPAGCHLFSAPIGTAETGYAQAFETIGRLLPHPNHVAGLPLLAIGPGEAHSGPYDTELAQGIRSEGFHDGHAFAGSEFSEGTGVFLVCLVVPDPGVLGSSPDSASGPVISNTVFPIHVEGVATQDGSHFPIFVVTSQDFGPAGSDLAGRYDYSLTMTDVSGSGWTVRAHFVVRP